MPDSATPSHWARFIRKIPGQTGFIAALAGCVVLCLSINPAPRTRDGEASSSFSRRGSTRNAVEARQAHTTQNQPESANQAGSAQADTGEARERGRMLFLGEHALHGRITGHHQELPEAASRCVNCHRKLFDDGKSLPPPADAEAESLGTDAVPPENEDFAPTLGPDTLLSSRVRRGGPSSTFNAQTFCRLLRDGVDSTFILIPPEMPRYTLSDQDCNALWTFLISR